MGAKNNRKQTKPPARQRDDRETLAQKLARYGSPDFAMAVTEHFHKAKQKALTEQEAAPERKKSRSA